MKYVAQVRDRRGRLRYQTSPHETREQAAQAAFKNGPVSARTCSTSEAFLDPEGSLAVKWPGHTLAPPGSIYFLRLIVLPRP
jgi:hypothetical protein